MDVSPNTKEVWVRYLISLESTQSMKVSLDSLREGVGGLDAHRQSMLDRVPESGNWKKFSYNCLTMNDLAYLTAKTGHEFAILRGKNEDILFHGESGCCSFHGILVDMLMSNRLRIFGHSHPGEPIPIPSTQDRMTLKRIGQNKSNLISGMTGRVIEFTSDLFDDFGL